MDPRQVFDQLQAQHGLFQIVAGNQWTMLSKEQAIGFLDPLFNTRM